MLEATEDAEEECVRNILATAQVVLEAGASLDAPDEHGWTRLYRAAFRHQEIVVEWLLAQGASCAPNNDGDTPLHGICWQREYQDAALNTSCERIIRKLVSAGISIESRSKYGRTPLHDAAGGDWGNTTAARTLLALGAQTDSIDEQGRTPLHLATGGYTSISSPVIRLLLAAGADPLQPDAEGKTPLDLAAECKARWECFIREDAPIRRYAGIQEDDELRRKQWQEDLQEVTESYHVLWEAAAQRRPAA